MRQRLGDDVNEARLRMANVPEGATLLATEALFAPMVNIHNVYIFPGIPKILQERFHAIKETLSRVALLSEKCLRPLRRRHHRRDAQRSAGQISPTHAGLLSGPRRAGVQSQGHAGIERRAPTSIRRCKLSSPRFRKTRVHRIDIINSRWPMIHPGESCRRTKKRRCPPLPSMLRGAWVRGHLHGAGAGQRRADFVALHHRQIRSDLSVSPVARLPAAISGHLRNRPLHPADRRKHFSGFHPIEPLFRVFSVDLDDPVVSLVRRVCRRRRHFARGAHRFAIRLVAPATDAFLGLPVDGAVSDRHFAQQSHLSFDRSFHVGRRTVHVARSCCGRRPMPKCSRLCRLSCAVCLFRNGRCRGRGIRRTRRSS